MSALIKLADAAVRSEAAKEIGDFVFNLVHDGDALNASLKALREAANEAKAGLSRAGIEILESTDLSFVAWKSPGGREQAVLAGAYRGEPIAFRDRLFADNSTPSPKRLGAADSITISSGAARDDFPTITLARSGRQVKIDSLPEERGLLESGTAGLVQSSRTLRSGLRGFGIELDTAMTPKIAMHRFRGLSSSGDYFSTVLTNEAGGYIPAGSRLLRSLPPGLRPDASLGAGSIDISSSASGIARIDLRSDRNIFGRRSEHISVTRNDTARELIFQAYSSSSQQVEPLFGDRAPFNRIHFGYADQHKPVVDFFVRQSPNPVVRYDAGRDTISVLQYNHLPQDWMTGLAEHPGRIEW